MNTTAKRIMMTRMTGRDKDMRVNEMDMRSAPYRSSGGYNDRPGVMRMGGRDDYRRDDPIMGGRDDHDRGMMRMGGRNSTGTDGRDEDYMRMGGSRYYDERATEYVPEMRRRRDSRGRYTSARMGGYDEPWMGEDDNMEVRSGSRRVYFPQMSHKIGFSVDGEMEKLPDEVQTDYRTMAGYEDMDEMATRKGRMSMSGRATGSGSVPFNKEMAMEWASQMENADGSKGPHWTMDQVKTVMAQHKVQCDPYEFFAALNMVYSDYSAVAKKMNVNTMDFYVCMAKAFLDDKDAGEDKLARYYEYVVK